MLLLQCLCFVLNLLLMVRIVECVPERVNQEECVSTSSLQTVTELYPTELQLNGIVTQADDAVQVEIAQDFKVDYYATYKVLTNEAAGETYVLYTCGMEPPSEDLIPEGAKLFETPLHAIAVDDTTVLTFLDLLGVGDRVKYTSPYSSAACYQKLLQDCDRSTDVLVQPNEELYDFSIDFYEKAEDEIDAFFTFSADENPLTIAFTATSDPGMINRLEWIKFLAVFFNLENKANKLFDVYSETYEQVKVGDIPNKDRPLVAWIGQTTWTTPPAYTVSFADYKLELVSEGGGKSLKEAELMSLHPNITSAFGSVNFDPAVLGAEVASQLFIENVLQKADVVIDETYYYSQGAYDVSDFKQRFGVSDMDDTDFPFLANDKLYTIDKSTGMTNNSTDWFESAVVLAHETLVDFVVVLQPEIAEERGYRDTVWLRNIAEMEDVVFITPEQCEVDECAFQPAALCPVTDIACLTA
eukprot:TRINITY_DN3011_c0_g3_i2.p1 TRINITY_DN3011_c0_g3~~TRINITY_DN3011_c0_g3_i2.p1  ORF type:complete len:497 (-),score=77.41 TRINITY_DN3011_c0_g3_i2:1431-2840(-)